MDDQDDPLGGMNLDALADTLAGDVEGSGLLAWLRGMRIPDDSSAANEPAPVARISLDEVVQRILEPNCKIITMAGAGISTSAGIPDFRTPGTGLYDNLAKYQLPFPEAIFQLQYFRQNPEAFYLLAKEMYPGKWSPTPTHYFVQLLEEKKKLLMHWTQNIDTLERVTGMNVERLVEAHGSFGEASCIDCNRAFPVAEVEQCIFGENNDEDCVTIPHCAQCGGLVKPNITFFGESLPERFFQKLHMMPQASVLLVLGTSLAVHPFASLVDQVDRQCPRVLINRELVGPFVAEGPRDVFMQGDCDSMVLRLVQMLGWEKEFDAIQMRGRDRFASLSRKPGEKIIEKESPEKKEEEEEGGGFSVYPKLDCPHVEVLTLDQMTIDTSAKCVDCDNGGENWQCLSCGTVRCSRYVNGHMVNHTESEDKCRETVLASFSDFSFWCVKCDSYIASDKLKPIKMALQLSKFGDDE